MPFFTLRPWRGLFLASIFALAFAILAVAIQMPDGLAATIDRNLSLSLYQWSRSFPALTSALIVWTNIHGTIGILIATAVICSAMFANRYREEAIVMFVGVVGVMLTNVGLKHLFKRDRPYFDEPLLTLHTYSFPSGHTASCVVFYGLVALFLCNFMRTNVARSVIVTSAVVLMATVGFSRMYLGVHYLSDVIAATIEGCCWMLLVLSSYAGLKSRRTINTG